MKISHTALASFAALLLAGILTPAQAGPGGPDPNPPQNPPEAIARYEADGPIQFNSNPPVSATNNKDANDDRVKANSTVGIVGTSEVSAEHQQNNVSSINVQAVGVSAVKQHWVWTTNNDSEPYSNRRSYSGTYDGFLAVDVESQRNLDNDDIMAEVLFELDLGDGEGPGAERLRPDWAFIGPAHKDIPEHTTAYFHDGKYKVNFTRPLRKPDTEDVFPAFRQEFLAATTWVLSHVYLKVTNAPANGPFSSAHSGKNSVGVTGFSVKFAAVGEQAPGGDVPGL